MMNEKSYLKMNQLFRKFEVLGLRVLWDIENQNGATKKVNVKIIYECAHVLEGPVFAFTVYIFAVNF